MDTWKTTDGNRIRRAMFFAGVTFSTGKRIDKRNRVRMLRQLSAPRRAAHRQLFERAAESGIPMPFEMADNNELLLFGDFAPDFAACKAFLADVHLVVIVAGFAVGNHDRNLREAVPFRQFDMLRARLAFAAIQHVRFHVARFDVLRAQIVNYAVEIFCADKGLISLFAEMRFERRDRRERHVLPLHQRLQQQSRPVRDVLRLLIRCNRLKIDRCHVLFFVAGV